MVKERLLDTDVAGQPVGPIFSGQAVIAWPLRRVTVGCPYRLSRNVGD